MLDMLDQKDFQRADTYYFEPSCGDGQMLEVIIDRIFKSLMNRYENDREKALADTCLKFYAIELDEEMLVKARMRIFQKLMSEIPDNFDYKLFSQYLIARVLADKIEHKDFFKMFPKKG